MTALLQKVITNTITLTDMEDLTVNGLEKAIKHALPKGVTLLRWAIVSTTSQGLQVDCTYGTH